MNKVTSAADASVRPSAQKLMSAALPLFWRYGLRKVSVEEICRSAGVSRMTFYRNFNGKDDLTVKVLGSYFTKRMETFERILAEPIGFEERLRKIVAIKREWLKNAGSELVRDVLSDRGSVPGKFLGELLDAQTRRTKEIFTFLQKKGEIRKDISVDLIMHILEHAWNAFSDERLLGSYEDRARLYEELFQAIYYGILPPKND
jgi:AcrR family transcriptional regulator